MLIALRKRNILQDTRLLRVRAGEGRNLVEERNVLLSEGCGIEVAHAGANEDEGGGEGGGGGCRVHARILE